MREIALDQGTIVPLVQRAARGDRTAFARIVAAYHADMVRVAFVVAGGRQDIADDAAQSAWAVAWRKLDAVREPERLKGWLLTVVANEARQILRHQRSPVMEIEVAARRPTGPDPAATVERLDLEAALARLPAEDRMLLALRYQAGLDSSEIGGLTGRTGSAVRGHLARVLAKLRRELDDGRA